MRTIEPMKLNYQVPMPSIFVERWPYKHEKIKSRVTKYKDDFGMIYGLRRIREKGPGGKEFKLKVLACIKPGYGTYIPQEDWVTDDMAWVRCLYSMNYNPKSVSAYVIATLEEFCTSTDYQWLAADAPMPAKQGDAA